MAYIIDCLHRSPVYGAKRGQSSEVSRESNDIHSNCYMIPHTVCTVAGSVKHNQLCCP